MYKCPINSTHKVNTVKSINSQYNICTVCKEEINWLAKKINQNNRHKIFTDFPNISDFEVCSVSLYEGKKIHAQIIKLIAELVVSDKKVLYIPKSSCSFFYHQVLSSITQIPLQKIITASLLSSNEKKMIKDASSKYGHSLEFNSDYADVRIGLLDVINKIDTIDKSTFDEIILDDFQNYSEEHPSGDPQTLVDKQKGIEKVTELSINKQINIRMFWHNR
jgi:hypothetical protein